MKKLFIIIIAFLLSIFTISFAQIDVLRQKIGQITSSKKATVGYAVYGIESKDTVSVNGNLHLPMQSVFKFHIALTVLNMVDNGKLSLDKQILIKKKDLIVNTWSPLQKKYPKGNIELQLSAILSYMVSQSDNNACDILLKLIGGPVTVEKFIHSIGIKDIGIRFNEAGMHKSWEAQFKNWTTPTAIVDVLNKFYTGNILSKSSFDFLYKILIETSTGPDRIKGQLPVGTIVAHKTGSSGKNDAEITAALNDIGIITLPNGKHYAICVFVSNSKEEDDVNEKIIADISKATWDYFIMNSK